MTRGYVARSSTNKATVRLEVEITFIKPIAENAEMPVVFPRRLHRKTGKPNRNCQAADFCVEFKNSRVEQRNRFGTADNPQDRIPYPSHRDDYQTTCPVGIKAALLPSDWVCTCPHSAVSVSSGRVKRTVEIVNRGQLTVDKLKALTTLTAMQST